MTMRLTSWAEAHRGVAISLSVPSWAGIHGRLPFLMPTWEMVNGYKAGTITERQYTNRYRALLVTRWQHIKTWLHSLDPHQDVVLCCWEPPGDFCHRQLVALVVNRWRPDIEVILE